MNGHSIAWFRTLRIGYPLRPEQDFERLCIAAWLLLIDGRAYLEDLEGAGDSQPLTAALRLRMAELLVEIDLVMADVDGVDDLHLLPMAMEDGLALMAPLDGAALCRALRLGCDDAPPLVAMTSLWDDILNSFPGDLPNPLVAEGQNDVLRALQNWARICRATGLSDDFLVPLIKAI